MQRLRELDDEVKQPFEERLNELMTTYENELDTAQSVGSETSTNKPPVELQGVEKTLFDLFGNGRLNIDEITRRMGKPVGEVMGILMNLERKRVIRRNPGNTYEAAN